MRLLSLMTTAVSFCVYSDVCWKLSLDLNVSHRVFEFFALFCHIKDKHWEQFLVIWWGYIWRRNQLFNIVKLCSECRGISINPWKFLLSKVCVIVINLRVPSRVRHDKHICEITVMENWWVVLLVSRFICLKRHDYPARLLQGWFHRQSPGEISHLRDWDRVTLNHSVTNQETWFRFNFL